MINQNKLEEILTISQNIKKQAKDGSTQEAMRYLERRLPYGLFDNFEYTQYVMLESLKMLRSITTNMTLPMIEENFKKFGGLAPHMRGLLWDNWQYPVDEGTTVFLQNYENRGTNNLKKKAYFSGLTADLYERHYEPKVKTLFNSMFASENQNRPLMQIYEDGYLNLYWDLHLQTSAENIPDFAKTIGLDFINCWAIFTPILPDNLELSVNFKNSYENVRKLRPDLLNWVSENVQRIRNNPNDFRDCFVHYWLQNDGTGEGAFSNEDITFECFHNYLALSQWGHTIYRIMNLLRLDNQTEDALSAKQKFEDVMLQADIKDERGFSPLDYYTFELFRVIVPNGASISAYEATGQYSDSVYEINAHSHVTMANSPIHWEDSVRQDNGFNKAPFNPDRYQDVLMSNEINLAGLKQGLGISACPYQPSAITTEDGRTIENNLFGTTYSKTAEGVTCPVIETAGYPPFGFGYRRCPGEILTVNVFKTFLRYIWEHSIEFKQLNQPSLQSMPIAPGTFITDDIGMTINARV